MYIYLLLNIVSIFFPLVLSFDKKVAFYKNWGALFTGILINGIVFITWDIWFTAIGVWEFNSEYLIGVYIAGLPLEEWLFFLTIPYACVFVYACLNAYVKKDLFAQSATQITYVLVGILLTVGVLFIDRWYTSITFLALAALLMWNVRIKKNPNMGRFYMAYIVHLIPFFIVNGVLTSWPVVIYNDAENLGIRMGTIPVEDSMYSMLMLLITINVYDHLISKTKTERAYA